MTLLRTSVHYLKRAARLACGRDVWAGGRTHCERLTLGNEYASWCVCPTGLSRESVVYSFGIGDNISFDLAMIQRFGVRVHAFDPTPKSLQWLQEQKIPERFVVHEYGLAAYDGEALFFPPSNPAYVSHSAADQRPGTPISLPVLQLQTIVRTLGHPRISVLKMDIEGAEYDVIPDLVASEVRIDQLLVEFHHRWPSIGVEKTRLAIRSLRGAGYHVFNVSANGEEYSFIRK